MNHFEKLCSRLYENPLGYSLEQKNMSQAA